MSATTTGVGRGSKLGAPLYITIGPPCSGKSTFLKDKQEEENSRKFDVGSSGSLIDIALDDQPNVYLPIPWKLFSLSSDEINDTHIPQEYQDLLKKSFYQKNIQQRLLSVDQLELRLVVQRLSCKISKQQLEEGLKTLLIDKQHATNGPNKTDDTTSNTDSVHRVESLIKTVEAFKESNNGNPLLPETVDLFVVEALFQKDATIGANVTGIELASLLLRQTRPEKKVAWGNTNTRARDYIVSLEVASQQCRPVHFCVYDAINEINESEDLFDLPSLSYQQLLGRNMKRFMKSGRYIPSTVIWDALNKVKALVGTAWRRMPQYIGFSPHDQKTSDTTGSPSKYELDRQLARLAGFDLKPDRTVAKLQPRNHQCWRPRTHQHQRNGHHINQSRMNHQRGRLQGPRPSHRQEYQQQQSYGHSGPFSFSNQRGRGSSSRGYSNSRHHGESHTSISATRWQQGPTNASLPQRQHSEKKDRSYEPPAKRGRDNPVARALFGPGRVGQRPSSTNMREYSSYNSSREYG